MREARRLWATGCAVAVSLLALGGCAPVASAGGAAQDPKPGSAANGSAAGGSAAGGSAAGGSAAGGSAAGGSAGGETAGADCTTATKVAIVKKSSGYAFKPTRLTIQRGAFLAVTNKSNATHPLRSRPDAGMVTSVINPRERQVVQFPKAGTFSVRTGDAVLDLTVAGESGCGAPEPTLTLTDADTFSPATVDIVATENFAVVNSSGVRQAVTCTPGTNKDHTRLDDGETQLLALDEPGRYVCASVQNPDAQVTVTVTAAEPSS